ncbi:hypothetical protein Aca07nite_62460 [Actinoplanes capillaceus]|uniref:Uncharacterized protein n=1 Tax=Actinoplanes campanulatus TaxID=113559 RepID=A0ABQ3WS13_9ACTN|nr:hypothetical protein [Actinoplanes capillaceus]GID48971.1 hypothetical protein Aca07nite_62460 [Actinoplanes capillaceus]
MMMFDIEAPMPGDPLFASWERIAQTNPATVNETTLRYKVFLVRVSLRVGGVELITRDSYVTMVDMALSAAFAAKRIKAGKIGGLGFTEHNEVIKFEIKGDDVYVYSSDAPSVVGIAARAEVMSGLKKFASNAHSLLVEYNRELERNPVISRLKAS